MCIASSKSLQLISQGRHLRRSLPVVATTLGDRSRLYSVAIEEIIVLDFDLMMLCTYKTPERFI